MNADPSVEEAKISEDEKKEDEFIFFMLFFIKNY